MSHLGLVLCLYFIILWGIVLYFSRGARRDIIAVSLTAGLLGPLLEYWHLQDYWHPSYAVPFTVGPLTAGLEDFIFSFAFAGSCLGFFLLNGRRREAVKPPNMRGVAVFALSLVLTILFTGGLVTFVDMNSVYAVTSMAIAVGAAILWRHPDWTRSALAAAGAAAVIMWCFYAMYAQILEPELFAKFWKTEVLSGLMVFSVPIEELLWAASFGVAIGPLYRVSQELGLNCSREERRGERRRPRSPGSIP